jgi:hypothetical protein
MEISAIVKKIGYLHSTSTETPTSFELAKEIVNKLPVEWSNPNLKILDPSCGRGTFLLAVAEKLEQVGHSRKHIVKNMLYGVDVDKVQAMITARALAMFYDGVINITTENTLEKVWDMKFDVIVGNPPYQSEKGTGTQPLWPLFVNKAFSMLSATGHLAMITPNKWCGHTANVIKGGVRLYSNLFKGKLIECNIQECSKYFPKVGGYENCFSYFIVDNNGSNSFVAKTLDSVYTVDKDQFEYLPVSLLSTTTSSIMKKVATTDNYSFKQVSTGFTNKNEGAIVISMAQRMHYNKLNIYYDKNTSCSATSKSTVSNKKFSKSSQKKVDAVFRSKLFKFIHLIYWNNDNFGTSFYNSLPYLDLNILWTDFDIYQHFGLTQEEIDYVEANVK